MSTRLSQQSVYRLVPRLAKNLIALGNVAEDSTLNRTIVHLVNLRVSQINHCSFASTCILKRPETTASIKFA